MSKANHRTNRQSIRRFEEIINVGPAFVEAFGLLGLKNPQDLIGKEPEVLYRRLVEKTNKFYDPCVLDVFIATIAYMDGNPPKVWWEFTSQRKRQFTYLVDELRNQYER